MESEIKKLFVGHLNWDTTLEGLIKEISKFGEVDTESPETKLMTKQDENTGRTLSRGFAFVMMKTAADAKAVVQHFQEASGEEKQIDGMEITVDFAKPMEKRAFGGGTGGFNRGGGNRGGFNNNRSGGAGGFNRGGGNRSGGFNRGNSYDNNDDSYDRAA